MAVFEEHWLQWLSGPRVLVVEGLENNSQSWPGIDNTSRSARIPFGVFCHGGQVNMVPGRQSGPPSGQRETKEMSLVVCGHLIKGAEFSEVLKESQSSHLPSSCYSSTNTCHLEAKRSLNHGDRADTVLTCIPPPQHPSLSALYVLAVISFTPSLMKTLGLGHHQTRHLVVPGETGVESRRKPSDDLES